MKQLENILSNIKVEEILGNKNILISQISIDSRKIEIDSLYIAQKGTISDGHIFIDECISKGAKAVLCDRFPENINSDICYIRVKNPSKILGNISLNFYDRPSEKLKLIGITGTNGKTTTVTLLFNLFRKMGFKSGLISTVCNKINDKIIPSTHTTPDSVSLNKLLSEMVIAGCEYVFMEVSSHAIVQNRISGLLFSGAIFSNISHDHLDYHKTFAKYIKAKKLFFDNLTPQAFALTNIDDKNGEIMLQNTKAKRYTYSLRNIANFRCKIVENDFNGLCLNFENSEVWFRLVGKFNAYNILASYSTALLLNFEKDEVLAVLSSIHSAEGRFEYVKSKSNIIGIVDYAHTPDALENVLKTIQDINIDNQKIITIVGCGGDRDYLKRPEMAKIACRYSSKVILTSDNPRTENPFDILEQMKKGVEKQFENKVIAIENRKEAIKTGCHLATDGDIILVAGKGHEKYQEINGVRAHFDDKEELVNNFNNI